MVISEIARRAGVRDLILQKIMLRASSSYLRCKSIDWANTESGIFSADDKFAMAKFPPHELAVSALIMTNCHLSALAKIFITLWETNEFFV